jgi:serine/threonine protein kinase
MAPQVFLKEAVLWGQLRHPNVLPFYGVYRLDDSHGRICLVSPWMENGTIVEYLRNNPNENRLLLVSSSTWIPSTISDDQSDSRYRLWTQLSS